MDDGGGERRQCVLDAELVGGHRVHHQTPVGQRGDHFVDLVVEPERADQLELPADGERDRHRLVPGWKDADHHHPLAAGCAVRRPCASAAVTAPRRSSSG